MPDTFNVIFLGTFASIDPTEGNTTAENAGALVGITVGGPGDSLVNRFVEFSPGSTGYNGGTSGYYDQDNSPSEAFSIDGGPDQIYDAAARYNATVTFSDGTTSSLMLAVFQDTLGNTYLAPETSMNAAQAELGSKILQSISLDSVGMTSTMGLVASRDSFAYVTCFARDTKVMTVFGPMPVQSIGPGVLVATADRAYQPVQWVQRQRVRGQGKGAPVRIAAGALGAAVPSRDLCVSRQHRLLVSGRLAGALGLTQDMLVPAAKLIGLPGIDVQERDGWVDYYHLLLDRHEVIWAEGAPTESLLIGDVSRQTLPAVVLDAPSMQASDAAQPVRPIYRGRRLSADTLGRPANS